MSVASLSPTMLGSLLSLAVVWLLWALAVAALTRNNPRLEPVAGLFMFLLRRYARLVHRLRVEGREHIPRSRTPGPFIVVANHTAGIDPILVQIACGFEIRWMMAKDMMAPALQPLWDWVGIIGVDRESSRGDVRSLREALGHLAADGVVGIFPEGAIARPQRGELPVLPFAPGVGLLVHKSRAPVLQVIIRDTPSASTAWGSFFQRSRARIRFLEPIDFTAAPLSHLQAAAIADHLHARALAELAPGPHRDSTPS